MGSIAAAVRDVGDEWLDAIRRSRMEEGTYLLTAKNLPSPEDVLASGEKAARTARTKTKDGTPPPPPCPELVQLWRDSCRVWPCRLFAFAAPTRRALATLAKFSKRWVEIGAGLGYWAHMMERVEGIDVVALDKTPSPVAGTDAVNEYHGRAMSPDPTLAAAIAAMGGGKKARTLVTVIARASRGCEGRRRAGRRHVRAGLSRKIVRVGRVFTVFMAAEPGSLPERGHRVARAGRHRGVHRRRGERRG